MLDMGDADIINHDVDYIDVDNADINHGSIAAGEDHVSTCFAERHLKVRDLQASMQLF